VTADSTDSRIARDGNFVDRVLFATKPLEAFKPKKQRDLTQKNGLILAAIYDHLITEPPAWWASSDESRSSSVTK